MILHNFAVIEGCDGSGTTTQIKLLKKKYENLLNPAKPTDVFAAEAGAAYMESFFLTGEPTQGPVGILIRQILKGEISVEKDTLARLFAADRGEHLYGLEGIIARCKRGELVVSDRYTPSSLVYQGLECGIKLPKMLNAAFPHPELLVYIDLDSEMAMGRIEKREGKDEIYDRLEFQARVRSAYLKLLPWYKESGVNVICLDGAKKPSELADEVWSAVCEMPIMKKK